MKSAPYFALNPPSDRTLSGPARLTSGCCITMLTPGCSASAVWNTDEHSDALSMPYFSVTLMVARGSPVSGSASAMLSRTRIDFAVAASTDSVIGIGQKMPDAVR